jgi:hypothetical protein
MEMSERSVAQLATATLKADCPIFGLGLSIYEGTALQVGRSRVQFSMLSLDFFIDIILPAAL